MITKLVAELIIELRVDCNEILEVGENDFGYLRTIMINGGRFEGEKLRGAIVPGGADWNMNYCGGNNNSIVTSSKVFAKYLLATDYGCYISIENLGYMHRNKKSTVIATVPTFHAPRGKYEWLNYGVYVASLDALHEIDKGIKVKIKVYKML